MTTESLLLYEGTLDDGSSWAAVAKTVRPASHSPAFAMIPVEHRPQVLHDLDWLDEPRIFRSGLEAHLPAGFRMPKVFEIDEADERITMWLEYVDDSTGWDLARYRAAACELGRLGAVMSPEEARRMGLRDRDIGRLFHGKVVHLDLAIQGDDAFWRLPHVAAAIDTRHRGDLFACAEEIPGLLGRLARVDQGICHGDATPDNLLGGADEVVAIDWSYGHVGALGSDLGQLLAGRFESGAADPRQVADIGDAIFAGYCAGLDAMGVDVATDDIRLAWATHLAIRSVFSALVIDHRPELDHDGLADLTARRAAVARFAMDLVTSVAR